MHKAVVGILCALRDALAVNACEERSRAGSIETLIVIKNAYLQDLGAPKKLKSKRIRNLLGLPGLPLVSSDRLTNHRFSHIAEPRVIDF